MSIAALSGYRLYSPSIAGRHKIHAGISGDHL
jgi:hypothetical protein